MTRFGKISQACGNFVNLDLVFGIFMNLLLQISNVYQWKKCAESKENKMARGLVADFIEEF